MKIPRTLLMLFVLALGLAGCGGGGSADQPEPAPPSATAPATAEPPAAPPYATESATAGTPSATASAAAAAPVGENTIVAQQVKFQPTSLTVPAGTTVTWANRENLPVGHTVTFGTPGSPSGVFNEPLPRGESVTFTFSDPGTFAFYCDIHRAMIGEITVS